MDGTLAAPSDDLLRVLVCGSVDDGKSTLIGRLLLDCDLVADDTLLALRRDSDRHGTAGTANDPALLLDGLEGERAQGITIDVAYRLFRTLRRRFVIADCPGHDQYMRNMASAASTANLAVILVDVMQGPVAQTRRHAAVCALFGIRQVVLVVNKMDLVGYEIGAFRQVEAAFAEIARGLDLDCSAVIPASGRHGDNIARRSPSMPWYSGPSLLEALHRARSGLADPAEAPFRLAVQWVQRQAPGRRGVSGLIASGRITEGMVVRIATSGVVGRVSRVSTPSGQTLSAGAGDAVTLEFIEDVDIGPGDLLTSPAAPATVTSEFAAQLIWFDQEPLQPGRDYLARIGTCWTKVMVTRLVHWIDPLTLRPEPAQSLPLNSIGRVQCASPVPVAFDAYADNRATGSFILVHPQTNRTIAAGLMDGPLRQNDTHQGGAVRVGQAIPTTSAQQAPLALWFTGLSGAGKTTIAARVMQMLQASGRQAYLLDGDGLRHGLNSDLGFSDADRVENIRRVGEVARLMVDAGLIVLCAVISPFRTDRRRARELFGVDEFFEIFVDTPLAECMSRDPKGLYARALRGEIANFTGVSSPYEAPEQADLVLQTEFDTVEELAAKVVALADAAMARRMPSARRPAG